MHKLSHLKNGDWVEHSFAPAFSRETTQAGSERIVAGIPGGDPTVFEQLVCGLQPPCALLYILHTPRGEGEPGRYQSPWLSIEELRLLFDRFGTYFRSDGRFDLWVHSTSEQSTVVWERHNLLYAYGAIERFASQLRAMGFHPGKAVIPSPHQHHYRPDWDKHAVSILSEFDWSYSPLRPEDEQ